MVFRKLKQNAGFSLIEVMVAITILGVVIVPIGSSLVLSFRLNARSEQNLQAQLAVSSTVETIMAEGFDEDMDCDNSGDSQEENCYSARFPDVRVSGEQEGAACRFTVTSITNEDISVTTYARPAIEEGGDGA